MNYILLFSLLPLALPNPNTCFYKFNATCPNGKFVREEHDGHDCGDRCHEPDECCKGNCRSFNGTCPDGKMKRDRHDGHDCGDECHKPEQCCKGTCQAFNGTCPNGKFPRDKDDGHNCGDECHKPEQCCKSDCRAFNGTCPDGKRQRDEDDGHNCGDRCHEPDECCKEERRCTKVGGPGGTGPFQCPDSTWIVRDEDCDEEGGQIKCNADQCCGHPIEEHCRSEHAQGCSHCGTYAPCLSSIDPHCIRQEALDCLPCDRDHNVSLCATCAWGWDYNCIRMRKWEDTKDCTGRMWEADNGKPIMISYPIKEDCWHQPPFYTEGHYYFNWKTQGSYKCNDSLCTDCELSEIVNFDEQFHICKASDEEDESEYFDGELRHGEPMHCPNAMPCGPADCVPGSDPKCVVFTVFSNTSTCTTIEDVMQYSQHGDYHAFGIADNTCRMDGSGRSYYKLTVNYDSDEDTGLIGCVDNACSKDCSTVSLKRNTCESPAWAHGLVLVSNYIKSEFAPSPTTSPSMSPTTMSPTTMSPTTTQSSPAMSPTPESSPATSPTTTSSATSPTTTQVSPPTPITSNANRTFYLISVLFALIIFSTRN